MRRLAARLNWLLRGMIPALQAMVLLLLALVPLGVPHLAEVSPMVSVMAVYYWSIYRPDLMPAPAAFAIGLVQDLLSGGPVGMMALVLVLVQGVCMSQRRVIVSSSFLLGWLLFMVIAAGASLATWMVAAAFYWALFDPRPLLVQLLLTVALYPIFDWLFGRTERRLLSA